MVETAPIDDYWRDKGPFQVDYNGTTPIYQTLAYNMEASTFPVIIDVIYMELERVEPKIRKVMPYCMFQHAMCEILNAYLLDHVKTNNYDVEMRNFESPKYLIPGDMCIPELFAQYVRSFAPATTPFGMIRLNLPKKARPQGPDGNIPSGFFGICDAAGHNAYECYISPAVTRSLIERTVIVNQNPNSPGSFAEWDPLPPAYSPPQSVATRNLLGYRIPEVLTREGINRIANLAFRNDNTAAGRICHSNELMMRVSNTLFNIKDRVRMTTKFPTPKMNESSVGFIRTSIPVAPNERLADESAEVLSSMALSASGVNRCLTFGLQRERVEAAPGPCYLSNLSGQLINGWNSTINSNFTMEGEFAVLPNIGRAFLMEPSHAAASLSESRFMTLANLQNRVFRIHH